MSEPQWCIAALQWDAVEGLDAAGIQAKVAEAGWVGPMGTAQVSEALSAGQIEIDVLVTCNVESAPWPATTWAPLYSYEVFEAQAKAMVAAIEAAEAEATRAAAEAQAAAEAAAAAAAAEPQWCVAALQWDAVEGLDAAGIQAKVTEAGWVGPMGTAQVSEALSAGQIEIDVLVTCNVESAPWPATTWAPLYSYEVFEAQAKTLLAAAELAEEARRRAEEEAAIEAERVAAEARAAEEAAAAARAAEAAAAASAAAEAAQSAQAAPEVLATGPVVPMWLVARCRWPDVEGLDPAGIQAKATEVGWVGPLESVAVASALAAGQIQVDALVCCSVAAEPWPENTWAPLYSFQYFEAQAKGIIAAAEMANAGHALLGAVPAASVEEDEYDEYDDEDDDYEYDLDVPDDDDEEEDSHSGGYLRSARVVSNDRLRQLGLSADSKLLPVVPVAQVAYADGALQPAERKHLEEYARKRGVKDGTEAGRTLAKLLLNTPEPDFFDVGLSLFVQSLAKIPPDKQLKARLNVYNACVEATKTRTGLFKKFKSATAEELEALDIIAKALDIPSASILHS